MIGSTAADLRIDAGRLLGRLRELSDFGANEFGGIDRPSFTPADRSARAWLVSRCEEAGLAVAVDGIGNMLISSPVLEEGTIEASPVWTGSHIDTVPNGGAFDGSLGSLAGIECVQRLHEAGVALARPVRAVIFADEEGNYAHLLGSSAITRGICLEELESLSGRAGDRFAEVFVSAGGDVRAATHSRLEPGAVHAMVELHIEQGPILESDGVEIGVVTGIVAIGGGTVHFIGRADHAGTTPIGNRADAGLAAARLLTQLPMLAQRASPTAVATSGIVRFDPGGSNVIPSAAHVVVDFRDADVDVASGIEDAVRETARRVAAQTGVDVEFEFEPIVPGAVMHESVRAAITASARDIGATYIDMPSGAGHDSQNMAVIAPTGMIFVPSVGGRSHSPAEHTVDSDIERGANVLLQTVLRLASK